MTTTIIIAFTLVCAICYAVRSEFLMWGWQGAGVSVLHFALATTSIVVFLRLGWLIYG